MPDLDLAQHERMGREHAAWLDVGDEFKALGLDMNEQGSPAESLAFAITKWGEELVQLRRNGQPHHAAKALVEMRERYEGRYERGEY